MEDSSIEWHRSRSNDAFVVMLWSYVIVSVIVFAIVTSDIMATLFVLGLLTFSVIFGMVNIYHVVPHLVGIADHGLVLRHRYRFRKAKHQEVPWHEISRLEFKRPWGGAKRLYTAEGIRILMIPDELADRIETLWKKARSDLGNATASGS